MDKLEFMKFVDECAENDCPEAILYELARQEKDTNSMYSYAYKRIFEMDTGVSWVNIKRLFNEVLAEENDHARKFTDLAADLGEYPAYQDFEEDEDYIE